MNRKIFKSTFLVSFITLIASIALIMGILFDYFNNELNDRLAYQAEYAASAVEIGGIDYLNNLTLADGNRITWISSDGDVIYDSMSDANTMENHAEREEFIEAVKTGKGMSSRYSATRSENTVYYAQLLDDGTVLRISTKQAAIWTLFLGMLQPILVVIAVALILSIILSNITAKKILKPINEIDPNNPDISEKYEEFAPLLHKIRTQNKLIKTQIDELNRKRDEFTVMTQNMNEGLLIINNHTELLTYNASAIKLLGSSNPQEGISVLSLNRSEEFIKTVEEALDGKHSLHNLVINDTSLQIIANPVYFEKRLYGAIILIIDITETEAREKLRREFTSNVSHELKTPLTSIYGMSEILMSGNVTPEVTVDFAKSIHDESARLIALINDIIKLSQLDEGSLSVQMESVDLYEIASSVVERMESLANEQNITMELKGQPAVIEGVAVVLDEIIHNLCENAIKYNVENGTVTITVEQLEEGHAELTVEDSGIGIPSEEVNRVFERFYRIDRSHSKTIKGTGLGLSIVKHGCALHDAQISLNTKPGSGTIIKIKF